MSDPNEDARLDLTAFDAPAHATQADRVVGRAMARIAALGAPSPPLLVGVAQWWYQGLAAAALIAVVAGATVLFTSLNRTPGAPIEAQLLEWARSGHVPNNGDLLTAFSGLPR